MDIFVARQAIFDRKLNIYAYELLYRSLGNGSPENRVAMVFDLVQAYEAADWDVLVKCAGRLMIQQEVLPDLYLQSVDWAEQIFGGALKSRCW